MDSENIAGLVGYYFIPTVIVLFVVLIIYKSIKAFKKGMKED